MVPRENKKFGGTEYLWYFPLRPTSVPTTRSLCASFLDAKKIRIQDLSVTINDESLYGGQFTLSTPLIKPNFCINNMPTLSLYLHGVSRKKVSPAVIPFTSLP